MSKVDPETDKISEESGMSLWISVKQQILKFQFTSLLQIVFFL